MMITLILSSEVGVLDIPTGEDCSQRKTSHPGKMLLG